MKIEIPFRTYASLFFAIIVAYIFVELRFQLLLLFIAIIIAMTLYSAETYFRKKRISRRIIVPIIIFFYLGVLISIVFLIIPAVVGQMMDLIDHLPEIKSQILSNQYANILEQNVSGLINSSPEILTNARNYLGTLGKQTLGGMFDLGILFISSMYMFLDGPRSYKWCRMHFPDKIKQKLDRTVEEIEPIMAAYVFGQVTTSTIAATIVYFTAKMLHIPAPLTLAFLAALFDILPGIGLILIIITASVLALAISLKAAFTISIVLVAYQLFESYILTPYIYGSRMKLSPLVVLVSLILAGTVGGVTAMIAVLPIVASYSTIERLWLKDLKASGKQF
ncbi:MAG: AI-2E family transporter [Bacteriovorax sp.]|nr:AI-2E family transporter [Bacteriovorax sp.]